MEHNDSTLHKLASAIDDVDSGVNGFIDFVGDNSDWLVWLGIVALVLVVLGCYICPALQICACLCKSGFCVCKRCCRGLGRYRTLDDEG